MMPQLNRFQVVGSVVVLLVATSIRPCAAKLPSTIKPCSRHHPHPDQCIRDAIESLRPQLLIGDLGDGFHTPPLEPMKLDDINLNPNNPNFGAINRNVVLQGVGSFVLDKVRVNVPGPDLNITITLPDLRYTSDYSMRVRLLLLRLDGVGKLRGRFTNTRLKFRLVGERQWRNGAEYVRFRQVEVRVQFAPGSRQWLEIEPERGALGGGELAKRFVRDNTQLIIDELKPTMEASLSQQIYRLVNGIFKDVTYAEMAPDVPPA